MSTNGPRDKKRRRDYRGRRRKSGSSVSLKSKARKAKRAGGAGQSEPVALGGNKK
jgi:hypothetical protein